MATLIQPYLNPVKLHRAAPQEFAQYRSKHMDDHPYIDTVREWETRRPYAQPWQQSDSIRLQFQSDYAPLLLSLVGVDGRIWYSGNMQPKQRNLDNPGMFIYEADLPLSPYPEGIYFLTLKVGATTNFLLHSEPLKVLTEHKHSVLLEYKNSSFFGDIIFETGFSPSMRVRGSLFYKTPSSKDSFFEDQPLNLKLLQSRPFDVWQLTVGGPSGIPDWLAKKLNRIFSCDELRIDGRQYTKADGAKWEPNGIDNYPMKAWSIDLRETFNRDSVVTEGEATNITGTSMIVTVDARGFGDSESASSIQIIDII